MRFTHAFIERPRFALVISLFIVIFGAIASTQLPVSQYPEIAPPQVTVTARYPGANAETIAATVAAPIEKEINGIEGMIYMSSQSANDGTMSLSITFKSGTNLDLAQILVQNRVSAAEPRLPEAVRRLGISTTKRSPDYLMTVNVYSPNETLDLLFLGNYTALNIINQMQRVDGVGGVSLYGGSEYAMRIWLDPDRLTSLSLTAGDVVAALRSQNIEVSGGTLNQSSMLKQNAFEIGVESRSRLLTADEFENVIVKSGDQGQIVRLRDVARIELGAENYLSRGYVNKLPAIGIFTFLRPGANALETSERVETLMAKLSEQFPPDLTYEIIYNPTRYVEKSIDAVIETLFVAIALVILVVIIFLQSWRTAIIPVVAIPISLIGTFALMFLFGYTLNMLSLFGLVLAIGIVVDDAIVVVENVERRLQQGLDIKTATRATMDEVGTALIATSLVLVAVFMPTVMLDGVSGQFYQQFGVTIAAATLISTLVSLTLSPAMAAIFMSKLGATQQASSSPARWFNQWLDRLSINYGRFVAKIVRMGLLVSVVYAGLAAFSAYQFSQLPRGFVPQQDPGLAITLVNLPAGSSLSRTDEAVRKAIDAILSVDDIEDVIGFTGFNGAAGAQASNAGILFPVFKPFAERRGIHDIVDEINQKLESIDEAEVITVSPPPLPGIGNAGGFKMMVQDRLSRDPAMLEQAIQALSAAASEAPETTGLFTIFETNTPRVYLDIDRARARMLDIPLENIHEALQVYLGSAYVNDFGFLGRSFRITAQAGEEFRRTPDDILQLRARNNSGQMIPLSTFATVSDKAGPSRIPRYNGYPAAAVSGNAAPGFSSGEAIARMEQLAEEVLPEGFSYEWTELAYQEKQIGNTAIYIFALATLFVFLLLTAQYESWTLPLSIILIVPMCLLSASVGLLITGMDNNILTQIGLIVLVGLASKNAILIVEFARQNEEKQRMTIWEAAADAARTRLRPILMTAFSFILGVAPLLVASGPGFEMRQAIGVTVFSGMLGVTLFGLILTPVFYVLCRQLANMSFKSTGK